MMSSKINNENIIRFIYFKTRLNGFQIVHDREPFKDYLADFARKGGGEPPFPLSFFEHNDSVKEKNRLKIGYFWPKNANCSPF